MSAIFGFLRLDGMPASPQDLVLMEARLHHRGQVSGAWAAGNVALGGRLSRYLPEDRDETMPRADGTGRVITAAARLDNRDDLIATLRASLTTSTPSEAQLILAAYDRWGEGCVDYLLGDFTFAIWDSTRNRLLCACDHHGVEPLSILHLPGRLFAFATERKALLALPGVPTEVNEDYIANFVLTYIRDVQTTAYRYIERLPSAHLVTCTPDSTPVTRRFWLLDPRLEAAPASPQNYAEQFRALFTEAVRARLRGSVGISAHLSGGLDSTSVACVARDLLRAQGASLPTLSLIFPDVPESDESVYINAALAQGGFAPQSIRGDQTDPFSVLDTSLARLDDPQVSQNAFYQWLFLDALTKVGTPIVLDGLDGDNIVSHALAYFTELALQGNWETMRDQIEIAAPFFAPYASNPRQTLIQQFVVPALPELVKRGQVRTLFGGYAMLHGHFGMSRASLVRYHTLRPLMGVESRIPDYINPAFAARMRLTERRREQSIRKQAPLDAKTQHYRQLQNPLSRLALEQTSHLQGTHDIHSRHPYFDRRIVEFCYGLPTNQKIREGWTRDIVRRGLNDVLPNEVRWRITKSNLTHNYNQVAAHRHESYLKGLLDPVSSPLLAYYNVGELQKRIGSSAGSAPRLNDTTLWQVIALSQWLQGLSKT